MGRSIVALLGILVLAGAVSASAQVVPSATIGRRLSLTAGGLGSVFQPDYAGGAVNETSPNRLYGAGAYVDFKLTRWVQIEGEGRWLRFNQFLGINESNYLVGPRVPIHTFWRATPYVKVLAGYGKMTFAPGDPYGTGRFTDIAYGGGVDIKWTRRLSIRAADFEYQQWPVWVNNHQLYPYGLSAGVGYRIF